MEGTINAYQIRWKDRQVLPATRKLVHHYDNNTKSRTNVKRHSYYWIPVCLHVPSSCQLWKLNRSYSGLSMDNSVLNLVIIPNKNIRKPSFEFLVTIFAQRTGPVLESILNTSIARSRCVATVADCSKRPGRKRRTHVVRNHWMLFEQLHGNDVSVVRSLIFVADETWILSPLQNWIVRSSYSWKVVNN